MAFSFATSDVLIELDRDERIRFSTGATEELLGLPTKDLIGKKLVDLVASADRQSVAAAIDALQPGRRLSQRPVTFVLGQALVLVSGFKLPDDPERVYLAGCRARLQTDEHGNAARDAETGLLLREDFTEMVADQIRLMQDSDQGAALTMMQLSDLDGLQDRVESKTLERLFTELGGVLRAHSVGGNAAGRLDDDKYGGIYADEQVVSGLMGKLRELLQRADPAGDSRMLERTIKLSFPELDRQEAVQAIRYAVNRFSEVDADTFEVDSIGAGIEQLMGETVERIASLKSTIAQQSFQLVFQPIVTLASLKIIHHEALSRFDDGKSPYEMITFAEQVGIIQDFDLAVVSKVRDYLWNMALTAPDLKVAVNLSARSLESDTFIEALGEHVGEDANLRRNLLFELTESYKVKNLDRLNKVIQRLRENGHGVCLDDFGGGGASFDYIQNVHVDFVKLDGAYVKRMLENQRDAHILKAMSDLCANLSVETIAEFVESQDQADKLAELGIQYGQGYLFGKPNPKPLTKIRQSQSASRTTTRPRTISQRRVA